MRQSRENDREDPNVTVKEGRDGDGDLGIAFRECKLKRRSWIKSPG